MFMGFFQNHTSSIGLILNLNSGHILPQYHVVYYDYFTTTYADGKTEPQEQQNLLTYPRERPIEDEFDKTHNTDLNNLLTKYWLYEEEKQARQVHQSNK